MAARGGDGQATGKLAMQEARREGSMLTMIVEAWGSSTWSCLGKGRSGLRWIARRSRVWRRVALFEVEGDAVDHEEANRGCGQMQEITEKTRVCRRRLGAVWTYRRSSTELKPKTVALSRLRCRRSGSRAGKLVVLGGARGQMEDAVRFARAWRSSSCPRGKERRSGTTWGRRRRRGQTAVLQVVDVADAVGYPRMN